MDISADFVSRLFGHRLRQDDIKRVLDQLSTEQRDSFLDKLADIVSKLAALLEVANQVSDTLSLDTLLQRMVTITTEVTDADRSTLFLNDPDTEELFSRIAQGGLTTEIRFPNHLGIAGEVYTRGEAVIIPDAYADPRFNTEVDRKTGYRTRNILCAPIHSRDLGVIGSAQVLNKRSGDFSPEDLAMLEAITSQAAAALYNARLHEQVVRAKEEEALLLEVTTALSSELNLGRLLGRIMEATKDLLDADRCTLFMHDEKSNELWSQVAMGMETQEIRFPAHLGIAGSVFTSGETVNIPDAYSDSRFNPEVDKKTGYRTRSILCMPVVNKAGRIIGVSQVLNKRGGPFAPADERRLRAFSAQASVAIENAKLFDEVVEMKNYNESMLESMSNGVISLDAELNFVTINEAGARILDASPEELAGAPAAELFAGGNRWVLDSIYKVASSGSQEVVMDTDIHLADGRTTSVNLTVVPLTNAQDEFIGLLLILEDITSEKRLKGTMARYMTKEVADRLMESGGEAVLGGQALEATILFSDIRSFTTISERLGPQETVSMLNEYFSLMVDIIFRYQGILDKYIGDAIMAVFGAPVATGRDPDNAVQAGVDMLRGLRDFNRARAAAGRDPIGIGIGICTDEILSGNIGSLKRMDYTVIGDGVNLASRLEGATKFYGAGLLISETTFQRLQGEYTYRELDLIRVKGKTRPVSVYGILDYHDEQSFPNLGRVLDYFKRGYGCFRGRDWERGAEYFENCLMLNPHDSASQIYLDRCRYYLNNPPPEDWDGVWVMTSK